MSDTNVEPASFAFTEENLAQAAKIIAKYPEGRQQSAVMPLLDLAQRQGDGWLPRVAMDYIADLLGMPPIRVYEVATFYTMFNLAPVGEHLIQVCGTTPCQLNGAEAIIDTITEHLGIGRGETTKDGLFTMMEVECLGACVNAPMVQINDDFYEDLNKDRMIQVLDQLKKGGRDATKIGPQGKRVGCIGPQGKTNLHTQPNLVVSRDFAAVKAEIAAKAKAAEEEAKKEAKK